MVFGQISQETGHVLGCNLTAGLDKSTDFRNGHTGGGQWTATIRKKAKVLQLLRERDAAARAEAARTISIEQAALLLGVGRSSAYAYAKSGALPVIRIGKRQRINKAKFEELLRGE